MEKVAVLDGNTLLNDFMFSYKFNYNKNSKYNTHWNWLIPVIQKIIKIKDFTTNNNDRLLFKIYKTGCIIPETSELFFFTNNKEFENIEVYYERCISFIILFNRYKK